MTRSNQKPPTHCTHLARLPPALGSLKEQKHWVNWSWQQRSNKQPKWTKPPLQPQSLEFARSNDPSTWGDYETAVRRWKDGDADGIGYMLLNSRIGAADLDHCCKRDAAARKTIIETWARKLRNEADGAYCEVTVSGSGLRLIGTAEGERIQRKFGIEYAHKNSAIELFRNTERYITISGLQLGKCDSLPSLDDFLNDLLARYEGQQFNSSSERGPANHDYNDLIRNGAPRGERSELFQAVVGHLAAKGWSVDHIVEELARYPNGIGLKYADRLHQEVTRSHKKWRQNASRASAGVSLADFRAYMPRHSYIYVPTRETWPATSVNSRIRPVPLLDLTGQPVVDTNGNRKLISASQWLDQNQPVEQMTWAPGLPELVEGRLIREGGWTEREGVTTFNLYQPPTIAPGDAGKAGRWLDHVRRVYPQDADHIIKYLAHRVQHPDQKINHALVLGGKQGIGKDTLLEPVKLAVGPWNFSEVSPKQIMGRFNGFLKSVILRVSEARDLGEYDRYALYDHLKVYTAAPPDVLRVDEKNLPEYPVCNCCAVVITTNHKTDGVYLPADDRRHYVAWSDLSNEHFEREYWIKLWCWYKEGGFGHVAAYLRTLDISEFDPKAPPPKTAAFWTIVDSGRAPENAELADAIDELGNPDAFTLVAIKKQPSTMGELADWLHDRKNRRIIPHRLEECGYVAVRNDAAKDGLWTIDGKRHVIYAKAELSAQHRSRAARDLGSREQRRTSGRRER